MIICGFPGVGKTMVAKQTRWVDLESTPFEKQWALYANVARHMNAHGYNVMVSTHKELLGQFDQMEIPYTVVIPSPSDKEAYLSRYKMRGNTLEFIENVMNNWELWIDDIMDHKSKLRTVVVLPKDGCLAAYIQDMSQV